MNKKTIAYILIGGGILVAAYYLYTKVFGNAAKNLGTGSPDTRGAWAAEDDALYNKFRSQFTSSELGWIDQYVQQAYETGSYGDNTPNNCGNDVMVQGRRSKAGSFACVIYGVAPNASGTFPPLPWAPNTPSLWPKAKIDGIWNDLNKLRVKYGGL